MKRTVLNAMLLIAVSSAFAQLQVSTKTFDLESQNKHKGWKIIEAGYNAQTQNTFVKFAKGVCDMSKSVDASTLTTTFNGIGWDVDKLNFDKDFNYTTTEQKKYSNSKEAVANNEYIYGKQIRVIGGGFGAAYGFTNNSYLFKNYVTGGGNTSKFTVVVSRLGVQVGGNVNNTGAATGCFENVVSNTISSTDAKEAKGQYWSPVFNHPVPDGGNILFNTANVNPDPTKVHQVFRQYNGDGVMVNERAFTLDYQCVVFAKEVELAPGKFDYVFIASPMNDKKSKGKVIPANQYEYFKVDGTTLAIKDHLTITAPNSLWRFDKIFEKDGAVYITGFAGKTADTYATIYVNYGAVNLTTSPNYQVAKIEKGKLAYVKLITAETIKNALVTVNGEKIDKEHLNFLIGAEFQIDAFNGKLFYGGRNESQKLAIFNEAGDLEAFLFKKTDYSKGYFTLSKDKKQVLWLLQDVLEYNKWDKKTGIVSAKATKQLLTSLSVITYNLDNKSAKIESLKNENWALTFNNTILLDDDNMLLLLGAKLTKKAKESEVVFVSINK